MAKKQEMKYSNDMFKVNIERFAENLEQLERESNKLFKQLTSLKKELPLKIGKFNKIKPDYEFEDTKEWKKYVNDLSEQIVKEQIDELTKALEKSKNAIVVEKTRLNLMKQGIPAWEGTYDNTKLLQESEKFTE